MGKSKQEIVKQEILQRLDKPINQAMIGKLKKNKRNWFEYGLRDIENQITKDNLK